MNILLARPTPAAISETFIDAHASALQARILSDGYLPTRFEGERLEVPFGWRLRRRFLSAATREDRSDQEVALERCLRSRKPDCILAEYGPVGASVAPACERTGIPLVVHFHGYDAHRRPEVDQWAPRYRRMFRSAAAVVAVSRSMQTALKELGCPDDKISLIPCGVDVPDAPVTYAAGGPLLFAGRMVEKKGPHIAILAFAQVLKARPQSKLVMIGDGPLLGVCRQLATALHLDGNVIFAGSLSHDQVLEHMRSASVVVQPSQVASDGDREGTPVALLEASAAARPVVSTVHAGIPDAILHEESGVLVPEQNADDLARALIDLLDAPQKAADYGRRGWEHMRQNYHRDHQLAKLGSLCRRAAGLSDA